MEFYYRLIPLQKYIEGLPEGYSEVTFEGRRHGVTVSIHNKGRSFKVFARHLGGNSFISFNYYITDNIERLIPCEMPEERVIRFLRNYEMNAAYAG